MINGPGGPDGVGGAADGPDASGPPLTVVNFSHPLSPEQLGQIASLAGMTIRRVIRPGNQIDLDQDVVGQVSQMVDSAGLTSEEWQTLPIVVVLPGLSVSAAVLVAELHGRTGYFPAVAAVRRAAGPVTRFEVVGVIALQCVRDQARLQR